MSRTSSTQAIEALAWHLNFFPGKTLSINELAEATGLAWATARKFAATLESIKRIAPETELDTDGIRVVRRPKQISDAMGEPMMVASLYVFMHAKLDGDPTQPIDLASHKQFTEEYAGPIEELLAFGLANKQGEYLSLTPEGLSLASDLYADIVAAAPTLISSASADCDAENAPVHAVVKTAQGQLLYDESSGILIPL